MTKVELYRHANGQMYGIDEEGEEIQIPEGSVALIGCVVGCADIAKRIDRLQKALTAITNITNTTDCPAEKVLNMNHIAQKALEEE